MNAVDVTARALAARAAAAVDPVHPALRRLAYGAMPSLHPAPPLVVRRRQAAPLIPANARMTLLPGDARLAFTCAPVALAGTDFPFNEYVRGSWIGQDAGVAGANCWALRFVTDSPQIELTMLLGCDVAIRVDGMELGPASTVRVPNDSNLYGVGLDFGADDEAISPSITGSGGGSGYRAGDVIRVPAGAADPLVLAVTAVDEAGAIDHRDGWRVLSWGTITGVDLGRRPAMGGSGSDAFFELVNDRYGVGQRHPTTRRVRGVEFLFSGGPGMLGEVRLAAHSTVRPWPAPGARMVTMQDSYGQVFTDRPDGSWAWRTARRLGIEEVWQHTIGGTGFTTPGRHYAARLGELAAVPDDGRGMLFVTQGSINDGAAAPAALRQAVAGYWHRAFAMLPVGAFAVQTGILRADGADVSDALSEAVRLGFADACGVHDPQGRRSGFVETRGPLAMMTVGGHAGDRTGGGSTDFWISGDAAHPTPEGHALIGDLWAADIARLIATA